MSAKGTASHKKEEEKQWREILAKRNPQVGLILIYDQKLCTVAHELGEIINEGSVDSSQIAFYANRLDARIDDIRKLLDEYKSYHFRANGELLGLMKDIKNLKL